MKVVQNFFSPAYDRAEHKGENLQESDVMSKIEANKARSGCKLAGLFFIFLKRSVSVRSESRICMEFLWEGGIDYRACEGERLFAPSVEAAFVGKSK